MTEDAALEPTLTPEALRWFQGMAKSAERDLARLPKGSQPLWFRTRAAVAAANGGGDQ